jgi:F0F1-type ATP synthase assembly protein I
MPQDSKKLLLQYAALSTQIIALLGILVATGWWLDKKLQFHFPLLVIILPLLGLIALLYKIIKDTSKK